MEHELPIGLYNLLLDPLQAAGELADGTLTLHLNKAPAYPMFNKDVYKRQTPVRPTMLAGCRPMLGSSST